MKEEGEEGSGCRVQGSRKLGMRNEELGMKVAASPRVYMGRFPKVVFK